MLRRLDPVACLVCGLTSALVLAACWRWTEGTLPLSWDASSHVPAIAELAERLRDGSGWWTDRYNLGFPLGLYYQPLPHLAAALLTRALDGGIEAAALAYRTLTLTTLCAMPWTVWYGVRRAGAGRTTALAAAALAPWAGTSWDYGFTLDSVLRVGLYTQAWGQALVPLVLGEIVATLRGRGRVARLTTASALLAGSHLFFAVALVPLALALVLADAVARPRVDVWKHVRASLRELACAGALTAAALAGWIVPLAATRAWIGGWPFGSDAQQDGPGLKAVVGDLVSGAALDGRGTRLHSLLTGAATDGAAWFDHVPLLSVLAFVGVLAAVARVRSADHHASFDRLAAITACAGLAGLAGRSTFGWLIDLYPLHGSVELFRYSAVAQLGLVLFAARGAGALHEVGARMWDGRVAAGFVACLLVPVVARGMDDARTHARLLEDAPALDLPAWREASRRLASTPGAGRVLLGPMTGLRGHYHGGLLAPWSGRDAGLSYGVGMHDSLNYFTLRELDLDRPDASELLRYLGFDTVVASSAPLPFALERSMTPVAEAGDGRYRIARLGGEACGTRMVPGPVSEASPREARRAVRAWLSYPFVAGAPVPRLRVVRPSDGRWMAGLREAVEREEEGVDAQAGWREFARVFPGGGGEHAWAVEPGRVECLHTEAGRRRLRVRSAGASLLVLPVTHHPFWRVEVDGRAVPTELAFPGLLAVEVPAGDVEVRATFARPAGYRWLGLLAPVALGLAFGVDRRRRRRVVP